MKLTKNINLFERYYIMQPLKIVQKSNPMYNTAIMEKKVIPSIQKPVNPERAIDQILVEKSQKGDKKAFSILVEKYHKKLFRLLSRMVRDQSEIEDIVQDSFIKAYRAINNFRGDSAFYTWLYRIGINTAKNHLVALGKRPKAMDEVEIEDIENFESGHEMRNHDTPESIMMNQEIVAAVSETIETLPEELKEAIALREMDGLSYEEIAEIMQCPIGTVRSRIFRAREAIAEKLKPLIEESNNRW
jgi:RNA polymerase sigma-70 factor (ECF subfamily)